MVAIGRCHNGDFSYRAGALARADFRIRCCASSELWNFEGEQSQHGVSTAERFEASQAESRAFVFVIDPGNPDLFGEAAQCLQRRWLVILPVANYIKRGLTLLVI